MSEVGPQPNPFEGLTDEQIIARMRAAEARLEELELKDIVARAMDSSNSIQPDLFGQPPDLPLVYRPEDGEQ